MDVRDRERQPDVALVVVIDKSGSMDACHCNVANRDLGVAIQGVPKVDIGKEAILRAVAALTPRDEFGVVAFNENAHWVIRTAPLGTVGDVESQIAGIKPEGQTNIFAGLSEAVASLEKTTATRRHIVLLTDGWSSSGEYTALIARMKAAGITLSTVGAGGGARGHPRAARRAGRRPLLPGRQSGEHPRHLPQGDAAGLRPADRRGVVLPRPDRVIAHPCAAWRPACHACSATTARRPSRRPRPSWSPAATTRSWRSGSTASVGRWPGPRDATGRWAKGWVGWDGFDRFFAQLVRWTFPGEETGGIEAEFVTEGDASRLRVTSVESDGTPRDFYETAVTVVDPELGQQVVSLDQVAPGVYEAPTGHAQARRLRPARAPEARRRGRSRAHARAGRTRPRRVPPAGRQ